jgi:hypothetical protein
MSSNNRILSRNLARELSTTEMEQVSGGGRHPWCNQREWVETPETGIGEGFWYHTPDVLQ